MPHLCLGEENTEENLVLCCVNRAGQLYDPKSVGFEVYEGAPWDPSASKVYPVSGVEDVTGDGASRGVYLAKDVAMDIGLTPGISWAANVGQHFIKWHFADSESPYETRTWDQPFTVEEVGLEMGYWSYISPSALRSEGLLQTKVSDSWMMDLIRRAQAFIERACGQTFRPVLHEFSLEGDGDHILRLSQPIIGIDVVKSNYSNVELDRGAWHAYAAPVTRRSATQLPEDHRRNPRVELIRSTNIYSGGAVGRPGRFTGDGPAHSLKGVFGFLESDGTTPRLIERAMAIMVFNTASKLAIGGGSSGPAGPLRRLVVDRHEQEWDTARAAIPTTSALATSPEVEEIIKSYRAPVHMAVSG